MNYVIIGASAAGLNAAESIREKDKKGSITVISEEESSPYSRCLLSYFLAGTLPEDKLNFKPQNFLRDNTVVFKKGIKADKILYKEREVLLSDKTKIHFDKLLLATGARPKIPKMSGAEKKGVYPLRNLKDARLILERLNNLETAIVLGGGLIGMRSAYALAKRGINVKVVIKSSHVLSQAIDKSAAEIVQRHIETKGIEVFTGTDVREILGKNEVEEVILDNGKKVKTGLVIVGKGVRPNLELVQDAGIKINEGIVIDKHIQTSAEDIFAAGDVAETIDISTGESTINALWPVAVEQGRLAGLSMAGGEVDYPGTVPMNSLPLFDISLVTMGMVSPRTGGFEEEVYRDDKRNLYRKFVFKNNRIVGAILMGRIENSGILATLIRKQVDVSVIKDILTQDYFDYAKILPLIRENPDLFKEKEFSDTVISQMKPQLTERSERKLSG